MNWISLEDNFPQNAERVLCRRPDKFPVIGKASTGTKKCSFLNAETGYPLDDVTHWMRVPRFTED